MTDPGNVYIELPMVNGHPLRTGTEMSIPPTLPPRPEFVVTEASDSPAPPPRTPPHPHRNPQHSPGGLAVPGRGRQPGEAEGTPPPPLPPRHEHAPPLPARRWEQLQVRDRRLSRQPRSGSVSQARATENALINANAGDHLTAEQLNQLHQQDPAMQEPGRPRAGSQGSKHSADSKDSRMSRVSNMVPNMGDHGVRSLATQLQASGATVQDLDRQIVAEVGVDELRANVRQLVMNTQMSDAADATNSKRMSMADVTEEARLNVAAAFVRDALHGRVSHGEGVYLARSKAIRRLFQFMNHPAYIFGIYLTTFIYVAEVYFLPPASMTSPPPEIFPEQIRGYLYFVELACSLLLVIDKILKIILFGAKDFFRAKTEIAALLLVVVLLLDSTIAAATNGARPLYGVRGLRVFLVLRSTRLRGVMTTILGTIPTMASIGAFIMVIIVLYSIIGVSLFSGVQGYDPLGDGFYQIVNAVRTMLVLITTDNYPQVMYPAMAYNELFSLYFVSFILIGVIIAMNVFLGTIVPLYKHKHILHVFQSRVKERKALMHAFAALDAHAEQGLIPLDTWMKLMRKVHPKASDELIREWFDQIDADGSETIDLLEFFEACEFVSLEHTLASYQLPPERCLDACHLGKILEGETHERVTNFLEHPNTRYFFNLMCVINLVIYALFGNYITSPGANSALTVVNDILTFFFLVEIILRIVALGPRLFWEDNAWNRMDYVTIVIAVVTRIFYLIYSSVVPESEWVLRWSRALGALRLVRILSVFPGFKKTTETLYRIRQIFVDFIVLFFCIMYFFAVLGMDIFRGQLEDEEGWADAYPYNKFSTFRGAMLVMFQYLVTNNWSDVMYRAMASTSSYAGFYFAILYMLLSIFMLNILVAIILEAFALNTDFDELGFHSGSLKDIVKKVLPKTKKDIALEKERRARRETATNSNASNTAAHHARAKSFRWDREIFKDNDEESRQRELEILQQGTNVDLTQLKARQDEAILNDEGQHGRKTSGALHHAAQVSNASAAFREGGRRRSSANKSSAAGSAAGSQPPRVQYDSPNTSRTSTPNSDANAAALAQQNAAAAQAQQDNTAALASGRLAGDISVTVTLASGRMNGDVSNPATHRPPPEPDHPPPIAEEDASLMA